MFVRKYFDRILSATAPSELWPHNNCLESIGGIRNILLSVKCEHFQRNRNTVLVAIDIFSLLPLNAKTTAWRPFQLISQSARHNHKTLLFNLNAVLLDCTTAALERQSMLWLHLKLVRQFLSNSVAYFDDFRKLRIDLLVAESH